MSEKPSADAPLSRPLSPADLATARSGGLTLAGAAEAAERAALAEALRLLSLDALSYEARLTRYREDGWRLEGVLRARLAQACIITLEPVPAEIEEPFERLWRPEEALAAAAERAGGADPEDDWAAARTLDEAPEEEPTPDPIDLGPVLAETLSLALDPYPRAPGVRFEGALHGPPGAAPLTDAAVNPFAALEALRETIAEETAEERKGAAEAAPGEEEALSRPRNGHPPEKE